LTDKIAIAFTEGYEEFEECPAKILKQYNPNELHIFEMEEAYPISEYINMVNDPVFTEAANAGKVKIHCVHLAPGTKKENYHHEFSDWDKLASIQPTRIREYTPDKLFLTQNHMVGYHRDYLIESLYNTELFDHGYISYKQVPFEHDTDAISLQYLKDKKRTKLKYKWRNKLYEFFPYDENNHIPDFVYDYFDNPPPPLDYWEKSVFNVVTESWYKPKIKNINYISEKTYSCIYHAQPFVIVGCRNMNSMLAEQGYEQYPCFDYSFDSLPSIEERIDALVKQIQDLCNADINKLYKQLQPIALHNQQHFLKSVRAVELPKILQDDDAILYPRAKILKKFMQGTKDYAINKNM
jgi:hypothetical protein